MAGDRAGRLPCLPGPPLRGQRRAAAGRPAAGHRQRRAASARDTYGTWCAAWPATRASRPGTSCPPHCLRHSAITFALDAGATLRDVQDYAGHKDHRTTRRYDHARDSLDRNAAHAVAAYLA